jgi:5-methyltetrahydropteroyltriglutamate--homocysteine methyltransferase
MSKIGYATYIRDRLSGFEGHHSRPPHLDLAPHPDLREALGRMLGKQTFKRAGCVGPVVLVDREAMQTDVVNLRAAVTKHRAFDAFMNAASPGVISAFQSNRYYPTHDAYVEAIADAMKPEYDAIAAAGFDAANRLPGPRDGASHRVQRARRSRVPAPRRSQVEALNHAVRDIPAGLMRMHICWGNYEAPRPRHRAREDPSIVLKAKPSGIVFEAANPRHRHEWAVWADAPLADDKILIPGCIMSTTNYVEHPELVAQQLVQYAQIVGRERVLAGADCGFGSFVGSSRVDPAIAYKKLRALVEGAERASQQRWGRAR